MICSGGEEWVMEVRSWKESLLRVSSELKVLGRGEGTWSRV